MVAQGVWLEARSAFSPLAAWLTCPDESAAPTGLGVAILPPVGYESSSSHHLWRRLADALAARGATVLRVDVAGCGDSTGTLPEVTDLADWRAALPAAADLLRSLGATRLVVVGCGLGATLTLLDAEAVGVDGVVTVAPVLSGRRFAHALRLIGTPPPADDPVGGFASGGYHLSGALLDQLSSVRVGWPDSIPFLAVPESPRIAAVLDLPAEEAQVDPDLVEEIADGAVALVPSGEPRPGSTRLVTAATVASPDVRETFVRVGPDQLAGVLTEPADAAPGLLVLINSGSDPHVGPGRAWVELARHLARAGRSTLRVDLRGWGESAGASDDPGRPYDAHAVDDAVRLAEALTAEGRGPIVLGGLCAGAWVALAAARRAELSVLALNPQMYWQPGDPVEALMSTTRERRLPEIAAIRRGAVSGRWDEEDLRGLRPPAGAWLDELVSLGRRCALVFAEGDDGLGYLRDRLGRRLREAVASGLVSVVELPDTDHGLQRTWHRPAVYETLARELDRMLDPT